MTTLQGILIEARLLNHLLAEIIVDFGIGQSRMRVVLEEVRPALCLLGKEVVVQIDSQPLPAEVAGAAMQAWRVRITEANPKPASQPPAALPGSN